MTVVCINDKWNPDERTIGKPCPKIGDKDTAVDIIEKWGNTFYILEKYPQDQAFLTTHFVDLPDAEPSIVAEEETEHAPA